MNGRERVLSAMRMEEPEGVPVWCQLGVEHIVKNTSVTREEHDTDTDKCVQALLESWELYKFDGILVTRPGSPPKGDAGPYLIDYREVPKNMTELDLSSWGDPGAPLPQWWSETYRRIIEQLGKDVVVGGWLPDPFAAARNNIARSLGDEASFLALIDYPEQFHKMLDFYCRNQTTMALAQIAAGVDSLHISNAWGGASLISKEHYSEFVLPYLKRFLKAIKTEGVFTYIHTCGFIGDRLELIADSGTDGIECMDPAPLGDVELSDAKKRVGDRVFLKGNVDAVNVLYQGTEQIVRDSVEKCLEAGMPGGGYILSTACSIPPNVPPEKIKLMVEIARNWQG